MRVFNVIVVCVFFIVLVACDSSQYYISDTKFMLDTIVSIKLYSPLEEAILDEAFGLCSKYENLFSKTIPSSDVSKINDSSGEFVAVAPETIELIEKGIYYGNLSGGLFDITIGTLSNIWNFRSEETSPPDEYSIITAMENINYLGVEIIDQSVRIPEGASLDLGGIAKGYIADKISGFLKEKGVVSAIINLGGNIITVGNKPFDGDMWNIGIQKPFADKNETITSIMVSDESVVSSGIYERYFEMDDKIYHHILNPKTGYPADNTIASVTIISDYSVDGDAISTICLLLGEFDGIDFVNSIPNTEAVFVTKNGKIIQTNGINSINTKLNHHPTS